MENREKFLASLDTLVNLAQTQGKSITMEQIKEEFKGGELTEDQFEPIYAYLAENKITVKNYIPTHTADEVEEVTKEESAFLSMYMEDLEAITECDEAELEDLAGKIRNRDDIAKNRMVEGNLAFVVEIAKSYQGRGVLLGDLIQEGNIGLMGAVARLETEEPGKDVKGYIEQQIRGYLDLVLEEEYAENVTEKEAVIKVSRLSQAAKVLEEELGRHPNVDEVAEYMKISKEEVENILRLSKESLEVEHPHHHTH